MAILSGDIIDAITHSDYTLRTLLGVEFCTEHSVNVGNSVVIFRVRYHGADHALRCYRRRHPYLREIYGEGYYAEELTMAGERLDVVLLPWVGGRALSEITGEWSVASGAFDQLAVEMLSREGWAHGDLSADNLLLDAEGVMHYIDCDSNFVEALRGRESLDLGTTAYQSPLRQSCHFDERIDHFSIALISVALRALSCDPTLYLRHPFLDGLLIDGARVDDPRYTLLMEIQELLASRGEFAAYRLSRILGYAPLHIDNMLPIMLFSAGRTTAESTLESFSDGLAWGYNKEDGTMIIPPLFDEAFDFRADHALVRVASWWYRIDRRGAVVERYESRPRK